MNKPEFPTDIPCQCLPIYLGCVCPNEERALRAYAGRTDSLKPMTEEQRGWCLFEIDQVEGYDRTEFENYPDDMLAQTVLDAWTDYCRDKGLL